jgi:CIC family chloride channel protein
MYKHWLSKLRIRLWNPDSLIYLSALGVLSGISCSALILLFRYMIEAPSALWLPGNLPENFEALPSWLHFALPLGGAIVLGLAMSRMPNLNNRVGVVHVITRLHAHHGHLPLKNALVQFFGGAFAIATGQSGGREGPAIHLGAAANSLLGQQLRLPNNSIRMLVGCGAAAAIAASFNTPIAGVIFAMEVIMMEYSVAGFIPVMMAAFTGTVISRAVHGSDALFSIPVIEMASLWEIPFILLIGIITGCVAALFMMVLKASLRLSEVSVLKRLTLAGLITGCCALLAPEVMGIGYDTLNLALASELPLTLMLIIIAAKVIATAAGNGLGLPIGLVGPNLLIGALIGSVMGGIGAEYFPELSSSRSFYVLLGMGAMMGAVLNAPLAALMALLELSSNTSLIFPGMLAITAATLTTSEVFKQRSAQQTTLHSLKELLLNDPVSLALQRTSVASLMERNVLKSQPVVSRLQAEKLVASKPHWVILTLAANEQRLVSGVKLIEAINAALKAPAEEPVEELSLPELCPHQAITGLHIQATLREALTRMDERQVDALLISGYIASPSPDIGIITRRDIVTYYTTPQKY